MACNKHYYYMFSIFVVLNTELKTLMKKSSIIRFG